MIGAVQALFQQFQDKARRAHFERRRVFAHVGVAADDVQAAIAARGGMRLVTGIDERAIVQRIHAGLDRKVIGALRQLKDARIVDAVVFDARFARARKDLPGGEERQQGLNQRSVGTSRRIR